MSQIFDSEVGRFPCITEGRKKWWMWGKKKLWTSRRRKFWVWECPTCKEWFKLSNAQWEGRMSIEHAREGYTDSCHEKHNYSHALVAAVLANTLS